jgi:predicted ATPase/GAF domain-containing protein/anti-anti-sigma regulatory factor
VIQPQNHTLTEMIRESASTILYRGQRSTDGRPVMVKVLRGDYPSARETAKLEHEHRLLASIDLKGVVKALSLERLENGPALVMEDFGGEPLNALIASGRLDLAATLRVALSIAKTLAELHQRQILHKDIKPPNIVCNLAADQIKLIGFGVATRLGQETPRLVRPDALEGSLAYMSPEQTGRMNRGVDHRTDLYALGVTLYEMLTGVLPFQTKDPAELVHSHIAKDPLSPRERSPEIPEVLSDIVMKLLAKAAEDRYQRAEGLAADLEVSLERWREHGAIAPFPLGKQDISDVLRIPPRLYGREAEVTTLIRSFERAAEGPPSLLLLAGSAGVGKSALVHEIHKTIARRGGEFIAGKFDQLHQSVPFAAFTQAFRDLIRQLLTEPQAKLAAWKAKLLTALGRSGRVLTDLIPELALVIGPQPEVAHLEPTEAQNRLGLVFQDFVRVFCAPSHPLVVFLDDLQWADPASLLLLRLLLADPKGGHLLLLGAYRERDVDAAHPLRGALEQLRQEGTTLTEISLGPLDLPRVRALLTEALGDPGDDNPKLAALAKQLFDKTHGNPFFLTQLLMTLSKDGLLRRSRDTGRWTWEETQIAAAPIAENVVEFMASNLQKLSPSTQRVLSLAACIGYRFDLAALRTIAERPPAETAEDLWPALREGLVVLLDADYLLRKEPSSSRAPGEGASGNINVSYRFLHDRVQQAAYSLIDADHKEDVHLRIGRLLRAKLPSKPPAPALFEVVGHLNVGLSRIVDKEERLSLARSNLTAGRFAKERAAYATATGFFDAGIAAAGAESFGAEYDLCYALYRERAECFCLCGRYDEADEEIDRLLRHAGSTEERADLHCLRMTLCALQGRFADGVAAGRAGLALLGVTLPEAPERCQEAFKEELRAIDQHLEHRSFESLLDLPPLPADKQILPRFLNEMYPLVYWLDARMAPLIAAKGVSFSLEHGHANRSPASYAIFGLLLIETNGRIDDAIRFGRLSLRLVEKLHSTDACQTYFMFSLYVAYGEPLSVTVGHLRRAQEAGLESGDFFFVSHAAAHLPIARYRKGDALAAIEEELEKSSAVLQRTKERVAPELWKPIRQLVACLRGKTHGRSSLSDSTFDEVSWLDQVKRMGQIPAIFQYYLYKLQLGILYDDLEGALAMAASAEETAGGAPGTHWVTDLYFYSSLAMAARYPEAKEEERARLLSAIARHQAKIASLEVHCSANEGYRRALVAAEVARIHGDSALAAELYDQAITLAHENGFQQHEALANELCAKFYQSRGRTKLARVYMAEARHGYGLWGATAKVLDLDKRYADLLPGSRAAEASARTGLLLDAAPNSSETELMPGSVLDLSAVLEVTQAIGSEIVLERLLDRLIRIVIGSAGAQAGALILRREERLIVAARATVNPESVTVGLAEPLEASTSIPLSVIQYVARTQTSLAVSAPEDDLRFSEDPYVVARKPKSILALALIHHGSMAGVLYLENNAAHDAFPRARVQLLEVLSAPAAIAVENALLYADVQGVSADLKRSNEMLRAANERLERELIERERLQEAQARMQEEIIRSQQDRLSELSTPLVPISDRIMAMPLIGTIDEARSAQMLEVALTGVSASRAEVVIIDITGVTVAPSSVASSMMKLTAALKLLGAEVVVTGVRPMVARSLIELGVDLGSIATLGDLKAGIAYALGKTGEMPARRADPKKSGRS